MIGESGEAWRAARRGCSVLVRAFVALCPVPGCVVPAEPATMDDPGEIGSTSAEAQKYGSLADSDGDDPGTPGCLHVYSDRSCGTPVSGPVIESCEDLYTVREWYATSGF